MLLRLISLLALLVAGAVSAETPEVAEKSTLGRFTVRGLAGLAWESYSLRSSGTGASVDVPNQGGAVFGGEVKHQNENSPWSLALSYTHTKFNMEHGDATVTPAEIDFRRNQFAFTAGLQPFTASENTWLKNLWLGLGYTVQLTSATETSPKIILPTQTSLGLHIAAGVQQHWAEEWNFDIHTELFLPHVFTEKTATTGFYEGGWTVNVSAMVEHHLKKGLWIGTGIKFRLEKHAFVGNGNRGSIDAVETFQGFQIPLQLRVNF